MSSGIFWRKVIFSISDVPERFQRISRKSVGVKFLIYHVTRPLVELKLALFKTCSDPFNMGRVCSVLMPVVTLQSYKMIGRLKFG